MLYRGIAQQFRYGGRFCPRRKAGAPQPTSWPRSFLEKGLSVKLLQQAFPSAWRQPSACPPVPPGKGSGIHREIILDDHRRFLRQRGAACRSVGSGVFLASHQLHHQGFQQRLRLNHVSCPALLQLPSNTSSSRTPTRWVSLPNQKEVRAKARALLPPREPGRRACALPPA